MKKVVLVLVVLFFYSTIYGQVTGSTVLIDKYNDTKHRIDENWKLEKGLIHLKVVHDPVSPTVK